MNSNKARPIIIVAIIVIIVVGGGSLLNHVNRSNAKAIISSDYSKIAYNGKTYLPYLDLKNPEFVKKYENSSRFMNCDSKDYIDATVEGQFFLWDMILADGIIASEDGKVLLLITDEDYLDSEYYMLEE